MSLKNTTTFTIFFWESGIKNLLRMYNSMIDINTIFHDIFVLCNLDLWFRSYSKSCEVPLNLFGLVTKEPVWEVDQLLTVSYSSLFVRSSLCKAFLSCMMWGCKVRSGIIVIWLNCNGLIASGSHHRVCLKDLAYKVNVLCSGTSWFSTMSPISVKDWCHMSNIYLYSSLLCSYLRFKSVENVILTGR